jgi:hypothetical protein
MIDPEELQAWARALGAGASLLRVARELLASIPRRAVSRRWPPRQHQPRDGDQ